MCRDDDDDDDDEDEGEAGEDITMADAAENREKTYAELDKIRATEKKRQVAMFMCALKHSDDTYGRNRVIDEFRESWKELVVTIDVDEEVERFDRGARGPKDLALEEATKAVEKQVEVAVEKKRKRIAGERGLQKTVVL